MESGSRIVKCLIAKAFSDKLLDERVAQFGKCGNLVIVEIRSVLARHFLPFNYQFSNYQILTDVLAFHYRCLAAAASYAGYATMAPGSQLYGRTLTHGSDPSQMALTFDDGPNDPHTLRLLDVLAKHEAKATFFLIGKYVRQRPEIARAILAAGHEIGNHTYSHPNLIFVSAARLRQELEDCRKALEDALGPSPLCSGRPSAAGVPTFCAPPAPWAWSRSCGR